MREGVAREDLFYTFEKGLFAYKPNPKEIKTGKKIGKHVLQSRNPLIGSYTECWCRKFFTNIAQGRGWDAVNGVVCSKLGLSQESPADLAFCTKGTKGGVEQDPKNIKLIFEVKMSIVNNYQLVDKHAKFCGDYRKHEGRPSFQRSDSMLKAIGKAINIRVSCAAASEIPIIILGNAPITKKYIDIVNDLKRAGVIQSFISVYPNPTADTIYGGGGGGCDPPSKLLAITTICPRTSKTLLMRTEISYRRCCPRKN